MESSKDIKDLQDFQDQQISKGVIPFKHTQLLFRPRDIIIGEDKDVRQCWLVQYTTMGDKDKDQHQHSDDSSDNNERQSKKTEKLLEIHAVSWAFNGEKFGPAVMKLKLGSYTGLKAIRKLKYYPVKYLPDVEKEDLVDRLIARGRRWCELATVKSWSYKGKHARKLISLFSSANLGPGISQMIKRREYSYEIDVVPVPVGCVSLCRGHY